MIRHSIHHPLKCAVILGVFFQTSLCAANPASTDYVNQRLREVTNQLQTNFDATSTLLKNQLNALPDSIKHHVGELYLGGIVFYVDDSGLHGLVAARMDASETGLSWQNGEGGDKIVNAFGNGLFSGENNTRLIVAQETIDDQYGHFAALAASNFSANAHGHFCAKNESITSTCYGGWYLPSLDELKRLQSNLIQSGLAPMTSIYWSSTEINVNQAYAYDFANNQALELDKANATPRVRAIRAF